MPDFEYIIIDGNSTDSTKEIIKLYKDERIKFISEPDQGISDAFNKGIKISTSNIIGIINSDDMYFDNSIFEKVLAAFVDDIGVVYGNALFEEINGSSWRWRCDEKELIYSINKKMCIPHPSVFALKSTYDRVGYFDTRLKIGMDYDFILRAMTSNVKFKHKDETLAVMSAGGVSDRNILRRHVEIELIKLLNGRTSLQKSILDLFFNSAVDFIASNIRR
jgi:glycosyltransferase involved in cell wall biosynthesis